MFHYWTMVLCASLLEAVLGYPHWLYAKMGHPVAWIGACIAFLERKFNHPEYSPSRRKQLGIALLTIVLAIIFVFSRFIQWLALPGGELVCIATLLASRSLYEHVVDVSEALQQDGLEAARAKVARIVGRDVAVLDRAGICRAAIESLAESFSDGVVAPLFWALCFGLPGIACYKAINTADSMLGHKDDRYRDFGWAAAKLDDAVNLLPARLSAVALTMAAWLTRRASGRDAWRCIRSDARKHASPNAGWPEAAMAGALALRLAGPQMYDGQEHPADYIGAGTRDATDADLRRALRLYVTACGLLWVMLLIIVQVWP